MSLAKPDVVQDPDNLGTDRQRAWQGQLLNVVGKISEKNRFPVQTSSGLCVKLDLLVTRFVPDCCGHGGLQLAENVRHQVRLLLQQFREGFIPGNLQSISPTFFKQLLCVQIPKVQ